MTTVSAEAENLNWLVANFVQQTPEVVEAIVVSADGLLMARSPGLGRDAADQFSAIASGLISLGRGAARTFGGGSLHEVVVQMDKGFLFVTRVSDTSGLAVVASSRCDVGLIAYEMAALVERVGPVLTPQLVDELKAMA